MSIRESVLHVRLSPTGPSVSGPSSARVGQVELPECVKTGAEAFGEWIWDGTQVTVRNCRLGFFPLFYYATENEFGVSPSIEALLACGAPTDLDDVAIATLLRLGWLVGDDTVFRAIRMVPPGGQVRWSGGKAIVTGGYRFPRMQNLSRRSAVDGYGELFREAVRRRASKDIRFGVPLSGGRDSRHILLELHAQGYRPEACFTNHDFPPYREENICVARLLTRRIGVPHRVMGQPRSRLSAELTKNRLNNYCGLENVWCVSLYPVVARYVSIVYEGTAGDILSAGMYLDRKEISLFERGRLEELANWLVERWSWRVSEDTLKRVLCESAARRFARHLAVDRVARELGRHTASANPVTSFYFWNRDRRLAALQPMSVAREAGVSAITPYLDHDLVDFLASLPGEMFVDKTFHTETIQRMYPEFDDIPYAGANTPLKEESWHFRRLLIALAAYVAREGSGLLVERMLLLRRLLAVALSVGGNVRLRANWIAPFHVAYLTQIEALIENSGASARGTTGPGDARMNR